MKKANVKIGRPPKTKYSVPGWAVRRIAQLARDAGAQEQKVLELALQAGLVEIAELYQPVIDYSAALTERSSHEKFPLDTVESFAESADSLGESAPEVGDDGREVATLPLADDAPLRPGLGETHATDLEAFNPEPDRFTPAGHGLIE